MMSYPTPCASTSLHDERVDEEQLVHIMKNDPLSIYILDCRSNGLAMKHAQRIRLPTVLFRRLQQGSLALSNVSPRLSDTSLKVVVIPGESGNDAATSTALIKSLRKEGFHYAVLEGSVERMIASAPFLFSEEPKDERFASDVGCLNLTSLRIEPEPRQVQSFPVQILPHLYLGNAETARNVDLLESLGIHHIINVTSNLPNALEEDPRFRYLRISVDDNSSHNLVQFFPVAINFISEAESKGDACLVHCLAGISRSVTICLAYIMSTKQCCLDDAYDFVLRRNAAIAPNFHFMGQLTDYQRHLGIASTGTGVYSSLVPPRSPSCAVEAAATSTLLTPPPTSCSASPQSSISTHSAKSFD